MENTSHRAFEQSTYQSSVEDIVQSIKTLSDNDTHRLMDILNSTEALVPFSQNVTSDKLSSFAMLSEREMDVLTLIASGYTRREIGSTLCISINTAASHISSIYRKLDIGSIAEATHNAIRYGVVKLM